MHQRVPVASDRQDESSSLICIQFSDMKESVEGEMDEREREVLSGFLRNELKKKKKKMEGDNTKNVEKESVN